MHQAKIGFAAVVLAATTLPALAADTAVYPYARHYVARPYAAPVRGPAVVYARPRYIIPAPQRVYVAPPVYPVPYVAPRPLGEPRFVVNQGPEYSGPDITISHLKMVNTDVRRSYPFIGHPEPRSTLIASADPAMTRVHRVEHVFAHRHGHAHVAVAHEHRPLRIVTVHHHKRVVHAHKQAVHAEAKIAPKTVKNAPTPAPKPDKQKPDQKPSH